MPAPLLRHFAALPSRGRLTLSICLVASAASPIWAQSAEGTDATRLDRIEVKGYRFTNSSSTATRTDTPLSDIPQAISVITQDQIRDQAIQSMADAVRYVPGMGFAQGEGNRDTPIFRGNASTADFFIDGMRDDVQYFRDVYNIDRIEVLKGPNAMIFGRGGSGGVLNRVTKQADWSERRELQLQAGSYGRARGTVDVGTAMSDAAALRVTGLYEDSESYRDGFELKRFGLNPTLSFRMGDSTTATVGYEHFSDDRTADRGIPSFQGRPLETDPSTFFGNPDLSMAEAKVNAVNFSIDHDFGNGAMLHNRFRYADYDKFYQNVFPGAVSEDAATVSISAYNNATQRENLLNQTDLTFSADSGSVKHRLLVGAEFGRQETDNLRRTGFFPPFGDTDTSAQVTLPNTITTLPVAFRNNGTSDANNHGVAKVAAVYVQDQIEFSPQWLAILGVRYDRFDVDFRNHNTQTDIETRDDLVSPRAGLIYKPIEPLSLYASYSIAHQPRAGEQLSSLSPSNQNLEPEEFKNYELGAKWVLRSDLALTAAVYRLDRTNVVVSDPADPTRSILVDGQRTEGFELELSGAITEAWRVMGGYAYADGEITETQSPSAPKGATLAQLPEHSFSLWNRYDFTPQWGIGVGAIHRSSSFTSTDNAVTLPSYTRVDAAVYYTVNEHLQLQLNAENLLDEEYFPNAHSNNNITPGSPRAAWLGLTMRF